MNWQSTSLRFETIPFTDLFQTQRQQRLEAWKKNYTELRILGALLLTIAGVIAPMLLLTLRTRMEAANARRRNDVLQQQKNEMVAQVQEVSRQITLWSRFLTSQQRRQMWSGLPPYLAGVIPSDVYLEQFHLEAASEPETIAIHGIAGNMDALQRFRAGLNRLTLCEEFAVAELHTAPELAPGALRFRLEAKGRGDLIPREP
jgi:Tfp pilus assembly protein PilN